MAMADIATMGVVRRRMGVSLPLLAGLVAYALTLGFGSGALGDPDIFWHIVTGRWIIAHGAVPHQNMFSFTMPGAPWVAHEWLAEPVMAWLHDHMGWHGLVMMAAAANGATMAVFSRALLRYLEPPQVLILAAVAWFVLLQHTLARPHLLALPLMVTWIAALVAARKEERAPPLWLALMMVPWVNLHGSFLAALIMAGFFLAEAAVAAPTRSSRLAAVKAWSMFIAAAIAASLVTPNGVSAYLLPFHLLDMKFALSLLSEWQSVNFQNPTGFEIWLLGAMGAMLYLGIRLPWSRLLMVLLLVHMALQHVRHAELLAFGAPLLAAPAVGEQLRRRAASVVSGMDRALQSLVPPATVPGLVLGAAVLAIISMLAFAVPVAPDRALRPAAAVDAALDHFAGGSLAIGPVLNDYAFGGYLISRGIPTFIDGRADMFGDAFIERHHMAIAVRSDGLSDLLDEYRVGWTLFRPTTQAVVLLDRMPGWRRLYADDIAVVHVRRAPDDPAPTVP